MWFRTKVVGVTFDGRQRFVRKCRRGEKLIIRRDRDNTKSGHAIEVCRRNGTRLGYIRDELAATVCDRLGDDPALEGRVIARTGGGWRWFRRRPVGLNILVWAKGHKPSRRELAEADSH